jgi:Family of unknown function (DUF6056)
MAESSEIKKCEGNRRIRDLAFWLPSLSIVALFTVIGRWVYWIADDFCRGAESRDLGIIGLQRAEYQNWSGRYTFNGLIALVTRLGLRSSHLAPPILAALALAIFTAVAARLPESLMPRRHAPLIGALGCTSLFGLYDNFGQSVLWLTGGLTYIVPFLLFAGGLLMAFPKSRNPKLAVISAIVSTILMFMAVGCNEAIGALFVGCLIIGFAFGGRAIRRKIVAPSLGSIVGFAVMAAAPGNDVRRSFTHHRPVLELPIPAATDTLRLFTWLLSERTLLVVVAVIAGTILSRRLGQRKGLGFVSVSILVGMPYGVDLLGFVGTGDSLVQRAQIAVILPLFVGLILFTWFVANTLVERKPKTATSPKEVSSRIRLLPICAVSIVICALRSVVPAAAAAHDSASMADRSNARLLRATGTTTPIGIPGPGVIWGLPNFTGDGDWALRCTDNYFKVKGTYLDAKS